MKMLNRLIGAIYCASYIIILTILFLSKFIEYATKKKMPLRKYGICSFGNNYFTYNIRYNIFGIKKSIKDKK